MDRTVVSSSNLVSIGWQDDVLEAEFKNGSVYRYFVPGAEDVFNQILSAPSRGSAFNLLVRSQDYEFEVV